MDSHTVLFFSEIFLWMNFLKYLFLLQDMSEHPGFSSLVEMENRARNNPSGRGFGKEINILASCNILDI